MKHAPSFLAAVEFRKVFIRVAAFMTAVAGCTGLCNAAPILSLTTPGGTATSASIPVGTSTFTVGLRFDSDVNRVSGLTLSLQTSPSGTVKYASSNPITLSAFSAANPTPFVAADLTAGQSPTAGSNVGSGAAGMTVLFKSAAGDYSPFSAEIVRYTFDTSTLAANQTYTFTPLGFELTNVANAENPLGASDFAAPGSFTLTVVPEPATGVAFVAGLMAITRRRRVSR